AVREPGVGPHSLQRTEYRLHDSLTGRGVPDELQADLNHGREVALVYRHLPVAHQPGYTRQQRLEEIRTEIAPRARDLLVETSPQRREPAKRKPTRARLGNPTRHVARPVADQRHHAAAHRRQDDLTVTVRIRVGDLDVEVELVHVVARAMR